MNTQTAQVTQTAVKHKSVKLTAAELKKLKSIVATYPSQEVAAIDLGLSNRATLSNILKAGSGRWDTIANIREKLTPAA